MIPEDSASEGVPTPVGDEVQGEPGEGEAPGQNDNSQEVHEV